MDLTDLRKAAIDLLEQASEKTSEFHRQTPAELIHELRVCQIELEMQNDELRRSQVTLEESRDRFANLFDFAPVGYATLDDSNRIVEANLTLASLLGVDRSALVGQNFSQYATPEDATELHRHLRGIAAADGKTSCEVTLKKSDGSPVLVRLDSIAAGTGRRSIAVSLLCEDAELVRAKRESDERLQVICHALPIPIAYANQSQIYQFNNAAHEQWFRISREAIAGRQVREVIGEKLFRTVEPRIQRALGGQPCACRVNLPAGRTATRSVEIRYAPHFSDGGEVAGFYELMFDVSASLRLEEQASRRAALQSQLCELSDRQRTIFDMLLDGKSNKAIVSELDLSARTVERERHAIFNQLGMRTINELLVTFAGLAAFDSSNDDAP